MSLAAALLLQVPVWVPFSPAEASTLQQVLEEFAPGIYQVVPRPEEGFASEAWVPEVLLFGFYRYELEAMRQIGAVEAIALEEGTDPASPPSFDPVFHESWSPAQSIALSETTLRVDSYRDLYGDELRGKLLLRRADSRAPEGLILGQIALATNLGGHELDRLSRALAGTDTLLPAEGFPGLLRRLPPGLLTLAPVREVVRLRAEGVAVTFELPDEGLFSLERSVARTVGSSAASAALLQKLCEGPVYSKICRRLDLEPARPGEGSMPFWVEKLAGRRVAVDEARAALFWQDLLALPGTGEGGISRATENPWEAVTDWLLLLSCGVFLFVVLRRREVRGRS